MIFTGLVGAILWNLLTWLAGLPSSSSHALFGGLIGAVWVGAGSQGAHFGKVVEKVLIPAVASPLPDAALAGGLAASVVKHGGTTGTVVIAVVALALATVIVAASRRDPVRADNVNDHREVTVRTQPPANVRTTA